MTERRFSEPRNQDFNQDSFTNFLEMRGFKVVESTQTEGEQKTSILVPEGRLHFATGFAEIDPHDKKFHYGNNDPEIQGRPLTLDFDSPEFVELVKDFEGTISENDSVEEVVKQLNNIIQIEIKSDAANEQISKMSDILRRGRSACAGKALIAASVLKASRLNLEAQIIHGASSSFDDKRSNDIGHDWLRINNGSEVVLYDPYFDHTASYDLSHPGTSQASSFDHYSVGAFAAANIYNQLPSRNLDTRYIKLVTGINGGKSAWVTNDRALESQIAGQVDFEIETTAPGKLSFRNGGIFSKRSEAAGYTYPLKDISKI